MKVTMKTWMFFLCVGIAVFSGIVPLGSMTGPWCFAAVTAPEEGEGECLEEYYHIPVENDFDGDFLSDTEEVALDMDETIPDEDENGVMDGLDLAYGFSDTIAAFPWFNAYGIREGSVWPSDLQEQLPDDQISVVHLDYQVDCYYEDAACGLPTTIGELIIVNPVLHERWEQGLSMPLIGWRYLRHGSFSYAWTTCGPGKGRLDPLAIKTTLDAVPAEGEGEAFCPGNLVADPVFASGNLALSWGDSISDPGNLLCSAALCEGGAPFIGTYWVRFYGRVTDDVLALGQAIVIPEASSASLTYHYAASADASGKVEVYLAGTLIDELTFPADHTGGVYLARTADITAYADGGQHLLEFVNPSLGGADVYIDAVCLQVVQNPPEGEGEVVYEGETVEGELINEGEGETPPEGEENPNARHPADADGDFRFMMSEAISYIAGWQQGANPMSYAIRAAYLWQHGEYYFYDPLLEPPLCWVSSGQDEGEGEGEPSGGKPSLAQYYVPFENEIEPNSPTYTLPVDVAAIPNYDQANYLFSIDRAEPLLSQNGFAVLEHDWSQYMYGLEENDDIILPYRFLYESGIPMFITSDTLLHLYHVQFDETLKEVEETEFYADIIELTDALSQQAQTAYESLDGDLKEAAKRNVAFLSVAARLLDASAETPDYVSETVGDELAFIQDHSGFAPSPLFIYREDYSQYVGTGVYRFCSRDTRTGGRPGRRLSVPMMRISRRCRPCCWPGLWRRSLSPMDAMAVTYGIACTR